MKNRRLIISLIVVTFFLFSYGVVATVINIEGIKNKVVEAYTFEEMSADTLDNRWRVENIVLLQSQSNKMQYFEGGILRYTGKEEIHFKSLRINYYLIYGKSTEKIEIYEKCIEDVTLKPNERIRISDINGPNIKPIKCSFDKIHAIEIDINYDQENLAGNELIFMETHKLLNNR